MLALDIDRDLNFNEHVSSLCRKAGKKLSVPARLSNFMSFKQGRILLKTVIESQFGYCPLIWIFRSRRVNNKINHLHERSLFMVYKDNYSSYVDLLAKDKSIRQRNIQSLAIELFKVKRNLSNVIMCNIFKTRTLTYNLRSQTDIVRDCVNTRRYAVFSLWGARSSSRSLSRSSTSLWSVVCRAPQCCKAPHFICPLISH